MVENDEIPFVVIVDKRLIPTSCAGCDSDNDLTEKISEIVLGDTSGEIVCWNIVKEINLNIFLNKFVKKYRVN